MRLSYMAALAVLAGCGSSTSSEVTLSATITDPEGDALSADVVSATAQIVGDDLVLTVTFAPGSFRSDSLLVQFNLDTDENEFTGYTTGNPGHVGFGIDCLIEVGKLTPTSRGARVRRYDTGIFVTAVNGSIRDITDGFEATVPADACEDDGPALLKVDSFRQLGGIGFSTRQDWAPDPGEPAARL
jgi:hypothetical protein